MTEGRPDEDVASRIEREADELEHHLHQLDDHIRQAQKAADSRRAEAHPGDGDPSGGDG
jgi:hypothetical protein